MFLLILHISAFLLAVVALPLAFRAMTRRMRGKVPNPPELPLFFICGVVGGYLLLYALGPSTLFVFFAAPYFLGATVSLLWGLIASLLSRPRSRLHVATAVGSALTWGGLVLLLSTRGAGGLSYAGHWSDDPDNWRRAFSGETPPPGVHVIHSDYTRSPHFTYEAEYYFEFTAPPEFTKKWIAGQSDPLEKAEAKVISPRSGQPKWFLPKPLKAYEIWAPRNASVDDFRLCHDRESDIWFVTDDK